MGDDRVEQAVRGAAEVAAYFGMPADQVAHDMAWHAGYNAGATEHAAFEAGIAHAEQQIMDWLSLMGAPEDDLAYRISRCEHRAPSHDQAGVE